MMVVFDVWRKTAPKAILPLHSSDGSGASWAIV